MNSLTTKFGEYTITYNEFRSRFECETGEHGLKHSESLSKLKDALLRIGEEPKVRQKVQEAILVKGEYGGLQDDKVTFVRIGSFGKKHHSYGSPSIEVWVMGGSRYKEKELYRAENLHAVANTPENQKVMEQVVQIKKEIMEYAKKRSEEQKKLIEKLDYIKCSIPVDQLPEWGN